MTLSASRRRHSSAPATHHRALRAEVLAGLLAKGSPVTPHAVDMVIAAGEHMAGRPPRLWTRDDMEILAWYGLLDHAHEVGASLDGVARAALQLAAVIDPDGERGLVEVMARTLSPEGGTPMASNPTLQPA